MKSRNGFVSNSSSSSFIISKKYISEHQLEQLKNVDKYIEDILNKKWEEAGDGEETTLRENWEKNFIGWVKETWDTKKENDEFIEFSTSMDNFNFVKYAELIGVPEIAFVNIYHD